MPELPEVEVVRAGLATHAVGRRITRVLVLHPRPIHRHVAGEADFAAALVGTTVTAAVRRGKFLWLNLSGTPVGASGQALQTHLGMSGQWLVSRPETPDQAHLRVRLLLDDGSELRFVDQRMFGGLAVVDLVPTADGLPGGAGSDLPLVPATVVHIARDALDPSLDLTAVAKRVQQRHTEIKRVLLNQKIVSGIGNIYADEALWRAQVHPLRTTDRLTKPAICRVYEHAQAVMSAALMQGGTSFDALYVNVNGESGYFERSLTVYGLAGHPCKRCGTPLVREKFMNRSSHFCPRCQRKR